MDDTEPDWLRRFRPSRGFAFIETGNDGIQGHLNLGTGLLSIASA